MMTVTFVMVTMQIFLSAAFLRAKAAEFNDAYNWIQEDFEQVLTQAKSYEMGVAPFSGRCSTGTLASGFVNDAGAGLGGATVNLGTKDFGGGTYQLVRTATNVGTLDPTRLVNVNYLVRGANGGKVILNLDTKVLIYSAFNCPPN
ncbi:MAG: prepilin-type cleavage/methylation domain-containing protein [Acaryochloridaceae cyanobacterium RL_2_7]|nr:prepilin-type cleavage/methylation domain-containing protein [Acaryochloridaceae cyanobacterium RL_2_7]